MESSGPPQADPAGLGWRFRAAFGAIAVNNLAAALDATSLSVALPVGGLLLNPSCVSMALTLYAGHSE